MMISKQNIQTVRKVGGTDSGISGYPNPFPRPCFKYSKQGRGKAHIRQITVEFPPNARKQGWERGSRAGGEGSKIR